jgi:hypothetical protein
MTMTDDEVRRINLLEILTSEEYPWVPPLPPALAAAWSEDSLRNFYQTAPPADVMHAWRPRGAVEVWVDGPQGPLQCDVVRAHPCLHRLMQPACGYRCSALTTAEGAGCHRRQWARGRRLAWG